jgi:hypothetical protein
MKLYDAVIKGPPKWTKIIFWTLIILIAGIQIGLYKGRYQAITESVGQVLQAKDREIQKLKEDIYVERAKLKIVLCESDGRHDNVWGDGGKSYGICQFQKPTFNWMRDLAGRPDLKWWSRDDQLALLDWALRNGYGKYWTCYGKVPSRPALAQALVNAGCRPQPSPARGEGVKTAKGGG